MIFSEADLERATGDFSEENMVGKGALEEYSEES